MAKIISSDNYWTLLYGLSWFFFLKILLGTYITYFTIETPRHKWTMIRVDTSNLLFYFCFQYQFAFVFILIMYSDLNDSSPALLTWPSVCLPYWNVKSSGTYFTTYHPIIVGSDIFIEPYLQDCTNDDIL